MARKSIKEKISSGEYPQKDVFEQYYLIQNHSQSDTAEHFGLTRPIVQSLGRFWGLAKNEEAVLSASAQKTRTNARSIEYKISVGEYPSKDVFVKEYIKSDKSRAAAAQFFGISQSAIISLCEYYNIHKAKEDIKRAKAKTCFEKYGHSSNLSTEECKEQIRRTCLEKYGVEHIGQSDLVREKRQKTLMSKYGVRYPLQTESAKQKSMDTIQKKYGVQWPCQTDQCQKTSHGRNSAPNVLFSEKLDSLGIEYSREFAIGEYSYDFKIGNILIEIDPWYTHQSTFDGRFGKKSKDYHSKKTEAAVENGFHCIHVFDWDDMDKIIDLFLQERGKRYARECEIRLVGQKEEACFLNEYHLQGYVKSLLCIGLYDKDGILVQLMSFGKPRYNSNYDYELLRLCSSKQVIGGSEKIFRYFAKNYDFDAILSYCDLSKFSGEVYDKLGFELLRKAISKHWYSPKLKKHITDNLLRKQGFDRLLGNIYGRSGKGSDNDSLMIQNGFVEIYDAGQATYIYTNNKKEK